MWKYLLFILPITTLIFVTQFSYIDVKNGCYLFIAPSFTPSNWNAKEVISVVKANDPESYDLMCKHASTISKSMPMGCPFVDGGCYTPKTKSTVYVGNDMDNLAITASILVHEICHMRQDLEDRVFDEFECYSKNARFLREIQLF